MNAGFAARATIVLLPRFDAATVLELMQAEQVTLFAGVPTMYHALLNCEETGRFDIEKIAARMRVAVSGGGALPVEVMRRFEERFAVLILDVVDRKKDMIIRGGYNVYPRELEEVLLTHPAVSLAAVVGVPHSSHGEEVKAFVVRAPGAEVTEAGLIAWCRQNMAAYTYPRLVEFRDSRPMTATGKILKRELARQAQPQQAQPAVAQSRS